MTDISPDLVVLAPYKPAADGSFAERRLHVLVELYRRLAAHVAVICLVPAEEAGGVATAHTAIALPREVTAHQMRESTIGAFAAKSDRLHASVAGLIGQCANFHVAHPSLLAFAKRFEHGARRSRTVLDCPDGDDGVTDETVALRLTRPERGFASSDSVVLGDGADVGHETEAASNEVDRCFELRPFILITTKAVSLSAGSTLARILEPGLFSLPPHKCIAVTGPDCGPIFRNENYQRFLAANSDRVQFFPEAGSAFESALRRKARVALAPADPGDDFAIAACLRHGLPLIATPGAIFDLDVTPETGLETRSSAPELMRAAAMRLWQSDTERPPAALREAVSWEAVLARSGIERKMREFLAGEQISR